MYDDRTLRGTGRKATVTAEATKQGTLFWAFNYRESFPLRSTGLVREAQPHLGAKVRSDRLRMTLFATSLSIPQQLELGRG